MAFPPANGARVLVTGGAGFIGSAFVRRILGRRDGTRVTVLDKMTYAGNRANLEVVEADPEQGRHLTFIEGDIADDAAVRDAIVGVNAVVNFAAESHVDRSILDPEAFLRTNILGVRVLLEAVERESSRRGRTSDRRIRFVQVSTDEVYGSLDQGQASESSALDPRSPYAAAKAGGELLAKSFHSTFGTDVVVTRGCNTYGPFQHPEKLIPLFITNALQDEPLPLYGDGLQERDWLHVHDHADAIEFVMRHGEAGGVYNVMGGQARTNREVAKALLEWLGKPWSLVRTVQDRAGHDRRYALDGSRLGALGWRPQVAFERGLRETVDWYRNNEAWWRGVRSGDWDAYYERQYRARLAASSEA